MVTEFGYSSLDFLDLWPSLADVCHLVDYLSE